MELLYWLAGFLLASQLGRHVFWEGAFVGGLPIDYLSAKMMISQIVCLGLGVLVLLRRGLGTNPGWRWFLLWAGVLIIGSRWPGGSALRVVEWGVTIMVGVAIAYGRKREIERFGMGLAMSGVVQMVIVIYQMVTGESLGGWAYWLGEREISLGMNQVAKMEWGSSVWLRPYGTFSHPNSMAGFALVAFWLLWDRTTDKRVRWAATIWLGVGLTSMSRAGLLALLVSVVVWRVRPPVKGLLWGSVVASTVLLVVAMVGFETGERSVDERLVYTRASSEVIARWPIFGTGPGNFIRGAFETSLEYARNYSFQPVHNVWLLMLSELGVVGVTVLIFVFYKHRRVLAVGRYGAVVAVILVTGLVDHYWLTLTQNRLMIGVVIGLILKDNVGRLWKTAGR